MTNPRSQEPNALRSRLASLVSLGLTAGLAACTGPAAGGDPAVPPDDDLEQPPVTGVADGTTGWAKVLTPHGLERLPYVAHNGHAIYEGDMDLGPIARVDERLRGGALTSSGTRWTNDVEYAFNPSFTGIPRTTVRDAIASLEARLPITFHEVTYGQHSGPWIEFKWGPNSSEFSGMSSAVGMMGCGEIHCSSVGECRTDCGQWIYFNGSKGAPTDSTAKHEILHALGLYHEQARNDRDSFIAYHPECLASDADQFAKQSASEDLGPYDFASIMHYSSSAFCKRNASDTACVCRPMTKLVDRNGDGMLDSIFATSDLSREDVNTVWRAYNQALGVNSEGDAFGQSLAVGDFDGDGYDDVAVGAPGNDGGGEGAGAVLVFKGTSSGLVPWHTLTQSGISGDVIEAGDHFGAALAAADLDGDGKAELLVGVPDEDFGNVPDVGEVHVYRGSASGPVFDHTLTQVDGGGSNEAGDRFGAAIAIGNLTATGAKDIAIGAPGDRNTSTLFGTAKSGAVYLLHEDPTALFSSFQPTRLATLALTGDNFGATLAIGKIDGDANDDLAIGAPGNGGKIYVYAGRTPPEVGPSWSAMATFRQAISDPAGVATDRFGEALTIADVSGSSTGEIVAGSPGFDHSAGRVYIYNLAGASLAVTAPMALAQTVASNGAQEAGDEFGAAVAAFRRDSSTPQLELVVGSPGENGTGMITLYRGEAAGVTQPSNVFQSTILGEANEAGDRFGAALAFGQLDGAGGGGSSDDIFTAALRLQDLVVGAPGERLFASGNVAAGEIGTFVQLPGGVMLGRAGYDQESEHRE